MWSSAPQAQDNKVKVVNERCEAELAAWTNLQNELSSMGSIVDSVDSLRAEMEALCGQLEHLDIALDDHLKAKEERDFLRWKKDITRDTENFQLSRARELANFERTLKAEQSKRIRQKAEEEARAVKEAELLKRKEAKQKAEEEQRKAREEQLAKKREEQEKKAAEEAAHKAKAAEAKASAEPAAPAAEPAAPAAPAAPAPAPAAEAPAAEAPGKAAEAPAAAAEAGEDTELEVNEEVSAALEEKAKEDA